MLTKKLQLFYDDIQSKRNKNKMRLQVDLEFQKNDIKELNKKYNVEMFSTKIRVGKTFVAEQKIRELKKRTSKLRLIKSKSINPNKLIEKSVDNMNKTIRDKYGISLDAKTEIKTVSKVHSALDKYDAKIYSRKKKKLREDLAIGQNVLLLAERIKKSQRRENFTKA